MFRGPKLKPKAMMISLGVCLIAIPALLLSFQNCAKFSPSEALSKISASCAAKIQEQAPQIAKLLSPVNCESAENYSCLVRTFSPDIENSRAESSVCIGGDSKSCVHLTSLTFNTEPARAAQSEDREFAPGGEYNRVEAQCTHSARYRDTALFVGLGDDLESAFTATKSKCLAANSSQGETR